MIEELALTVIDPFFAKWIVCLTTLMGIYNYLENDYYSITIEERNINALLSLLGAFLLLCFPNSILEAVAEWSIYSVLGLLEMPELPLIVRFLAWSSTIVYATLLELCVRLSLRLAKQRLI